mgnify:CR=1 FL=1
MEKTINYELVYTDFLGRRQRQSFIKTEEEAKRRQEELYNSVDCNSVINKVTQLWKNDDCVQISRRLVS